MPVVPPRVRLRYNPGMTEEGAATDRRGVDDTVITAGAAIVFFDDDETPVDFVLHLLETRLGYNEDRARRAVEAIRRHGHCIVAEQPPLIARQTMQRLTLTVKAAGYPMKIELREGGR